MFVVQGKLATISSQERTHSILSRFWSKPCSLQNNPKVNTVLFTINIIATPSTNSTFSFIKPVERERKKEKQKVTRNMKILRITLAMAILLFLLQLQPNVAGRTLHEKLTMVRRRELELKLKLQSLQRVSVPPSGPSGCTFIPGTNGPGCPLKERHYAAKRSTRRPITHRRHSAPVRVVETLI